MVLGFGALSLCCKVVASALSSCFCQSPILDAIERPVVFFKMPGPCGPPAADLQVGRLMLAGFGIEVF